MACVAFSATSMELRDVWNFSKITKSQSNWKRPYLDLVQACSGTISCRHFVKKMTSSVPIMESTIRKSHGRHNSSTYLSTLPVHLPFWYRSTFHRALAYWPAATEAVTWPMHKKLYLSAPLQLSSQPALYTYPSYFFSARPTIHFLSVISLENHLAKN